MGEVAADRLGEVAITEGHIRDPHSLSRLAQEIVKRIDRGKFDLEEVGWATRGPAAALAYIQAGGERTFLIALYPEDQRS